MITRRGLFVTLAALGGGLKAALSAKTSPPCDFCGWCTPAGPPQPDFHWGEDPREHKNWPFHPGSGVWATNGFHGSVRPSMDAIYVWRDDAAYETMSKHLEEVLCGKSPRFPQ